MSILETFDSASRVQSDAKKTRLLASGRNKPARIATRTKWALGDMLHHAQEGRAKMEEMQVWIKRERLDAKGRFDTARLERLGELSELMTDLALHVGELERLASDARVGIYEPRLVAAGKERHAKQ